MTFINDFIEIFTELKLWEKIFTILYIGVVLFTSVLCVWVLVASDASWFERLISLLVLLYEAVLVGMVVMLD